ncbi:CDGSH iron-sulfur domain-containing protein [Corynebacterium ulceribovis]|uniref:CDGSH iron-sulfur domain-containing protein n=1 Tax=Corynebacterium ulceribovis TaxID=487732 RepID=UPI000A013126|nr:CDGSH iron-sulfur domain-containing protein [Corynebacterium ulceribovis]
MDCPQDNRTAVRVCQDGPLLIRGPITVELPDGAKIDIARGPVALCRCGKTANAPWCDASHKNARR